MYQPSLLIVGSRNKTKYKHAYSGAGIFKYRLKHSTIPVVIVRDTPKQRKGITSATTTATTTTTTVTTSATTTTAPNSSYKSNAFSHKNNAPMSKRMKKTLSLFNCTV